MSTPGDGRLSTHCCLSGLREADAHDVRYAAITGRHSRVIESMAKSKLSFATCAFHLP